MASKPITICQLVKAKLIDTNRGFVETFNWLASYVANLKGETEAEVSGHTDNKLYIEIDGKTTDHPVLKVKGQAGMKLKSGEDSNVVISSEPDSDGYYTIDVYYV